MIILDANVVSEMMEVEPDAPVSAWLDQADESSLWLTAILIFEIKGGLDYMVAGRRRQRLIAAFGSILRMGFEDRVLPFDQEAAAVAGSIEADRKRSGRPIDIKDTLIAGIAVSRGAAIATRNVRHFADLPIQVIDPWSA